MNKQKIYKEIDGLSIIKLSVLAQRLGVDVDSIREKHMDMLAKSLQSAIVEAKSRKRSEGER